MKMKAITLNLLLALSSILLTIILVEGGIRLLFGTTPTPERFTADPQLGWVWTPNYNQIESYKQGSSFQMQVNSQGYRDEHAYVQPKPQDTVRIIALGDSVVASPGVALAESFPQLLEQLIQQDSPNQQIEVINAGVDDYSTEQELLWLREKGVAFEPDLLIVHVYLNDSRSFVRPSPTQAAISNLLANRSAAETFVRDTLFARRTEQIVETEEFRFRFKSALNEDSWHHDPAALTQLIQAADQDWGLAWYDSELKHIETQLQEMGRIAAENDFPLLLVIFPVNIQVYAQTDTPLDLLGPQYELSQFAAHAQLPLLDIQPVLAASGLAEDMLFYDWVHLKPAGHQLVAEAIKAAIADYHLLAE